MNNECTKENVEKRLLENKILFLGLIIFFQVVYWINVVISSGCYLQTYFSNDINDTFMDFFNMLNLANYDDPYIFQSNYPPFVFMILKLLYRIVPLQARTTDAFALRDNEFAFICLILFFGVSYGLLIYAVRKLIQDEHLFWLTIVVCVLSGPMLFCVERGNVLLLSIACLMMYMAFWDSPQKWKRYVAYVFLAISAAIKIYPACFGLLVLLRKRWKEAACLVGMGSAAYVLPSFLFRGFYSLKDSIEGLFISSQISNNWGMGYNFSIRNIWKIMWAIRGNIETSAPGGIVIIAAIPSIIIFLSSKELWKKLFAISLFCIWIPKFSYTYTLVFFLIPFIMFIIEVSMEKINIIYGAFMGIILVPLYLPLTNLDFEGAKFPLSWPTMIINIVIIAMCGLILYDNFYKSKRPLNCKSSDALEMSKEIELSELSKETVELNDEIHNNEVNTKDQVKKTSDIQLTAILNCFKFIERKKLLLTVVCFFVGLMIFRNFLFYSSDNIGFFPIDSSIMSEYEQKDDCFMPCDESAAIYVNNFDGIGNEINISFKSGLKENTTFQVYNTSSDVEQYLITQKEVRKGYRSVSFYFEDTHINAITIIARSIDGSHLVSIPLGTISINQRYATVIQKKWGYWLMLVTLILVSIALTRVVCIENSGCVKVQGRDTRDSNLELLRIISMILIVAHHFAVHGGLLNFSNQKSKFVGLIFLPVGKICFIAFIAISMYFLVDGKSKSERFLRCWLEVAFYSVSLTVVTWGMGGIVSFKDLISSMCVMIGNSHGFAASYLLFLLIYPFVLKATKNCSKKQARYLLVVVFWLQIMSQIIGVWTGYRQPVCSELILFIFCYILSLNLKRYPIKAFDNVWCDLGIVVGIYAYSFVINTVARNGWLNSVTSFYYGITSDESSVFYIIAGYALFYLFKNIHVPHSRLINAVASGTFGVLLIHDHNFFRKIFWNEVIRTKTFYSTNNFVIYFVLNVFAIFFVCLVLDYLRQNILERKIVRLDFFDNVAKEMDEVLASEE